MDGKKIENLLESKSTVAGKGQLSLGVTRCHKSNFLVNRVGETMCLQNDIKSTDRDN